MHSSTTFHLYTVLCVHHPKSSPSITIYPSFILLPPSTTPGNLLSIFKIPFRKFKHSVLNLKIYFYLFLFPSISFTVVQAQFSAFSPHPRRPHLSPISTLPPTIIVHVFFIIVPANPSPFSPEILSPLPTGHCLFQTFASFSLMRNEEGLPSTGV